MSHLNHPASECTHFRDKIHPGPWQALRMPFLGLIGHALFWRSQTLRRSYFFEDGCAWSEFRTDLTTAKSDGTLGNLPNERNPT